MSESRFTDVATDALINLLEKDQGDFKRVNGTYEILSFLFHALGENAGLHFSTLFARIAHFASVLKLDAHITRGLHQFRIDAQILINQKEGLNEDAIGPLADNGVYLVAHVISAIDPENPVVERISDLGAYFLVLRDLPENDVKFKRHLRFIAQEHLIDKDLLYGVIDPDGTVACLSYSDTGRSDLYRENVLDAVGLLGLPITMSLVDVEYDSDMHLSPRMIVIEPDYLIDVTSVAECNQPSGADSRLAMIRSFLPQSWSVPLLLGSVANFFLDEIIKRPEVTFEDLLPRIFRLQPVLISQMPDADLHKLIDSARSHFNTLKGVVNNDFKQVGINREGVSIEPTFYAPIFGLQGRLDLYYRSTDAGIQNDEQRRQDVHTGIVELKSGKPFRPNTYGLSSTHYTQTLLYHLLLRSVSDFTERPSAFILYSGQKVNSLHIAPVVGSLQREAIRLRNQIYISQAAMAIDGSGLDNFTDSAFPGLTGFLRRDIERLSKAIHQLTDVERSYFQVMIKLIAGEQLIAKLGADNGRRRSGLSGIWLLSEKEKQEQFSLLRDLSIVSQDDRESDQSIITLEKGADTNELANFREGDIVVLYPSTGSARPSALTSEVFKATLVEIGPRVIKIRLRNDQVSFHRFMAYASWCIEADVLDSSFVSLQRSMFRFTEFHPTRRAVFLGLEPPGRTKEAGPEEIPLLDRMLKARDYFLLWGPPGTGKTSIVLRDLVKHYLENTPERILLLAYTNRAVDEISRAVSSVLTGTDENFIRIGSRISTAPEFRNQLLSVMLDDISRRSEVNSLLNSTRIFVSTISSISGSMEILTQLKFSVAIVDEASQILEPALAGLLPMFNKTILIGDHRQLPAVVSQSEDQTKISDNSLHAINMTNARVSYFERMYKLASTNRWDYAIGELTKQGRMHREIQDFASDHFYDGKLQLIGNTSSRDYTGPLSWEFDEDGPMNSILGTKRMLFFDANDESRLPWSKTSDSEASKVANIVRTLTQIKKGPSIGIITPFRAQIANIREHIVSEGLDATKMTIDTVERYQGSARDIIILSTAVGLERQMRQIVSKSEEGIDRKLNVALTRAREQFILVGCEKVLATEPSYRALIKACHKMSAEAKFND